MQLEGFHNISESLKCGVYALCQSGVVVYVGKSKCMLVRIYSHRNAKSKKGSLPSWFPVKGIAFDEVHVQPCHPDRVDALEYDLINRYKPKFNTLLKNNLHIQTPFTIKVGSVSIALCADEVRTPALNRRI